MKFNNIDEIIKNGLYETERRHELLALQAKSRIWNMVEKPKRKPAMHWGFVSALAASVTLFVISTLLFLKLEHQQKELENLQAFANQEIRTLGDFEEIAPIEPEPGVEEVQLAPTEEENKHTITIPIPQNSHLTKIDPEEINPIESELKPTLEAIVIAVKPEIEITDIFISELKAEMNLPQGSNQEVLPEPKSNTKGKLKFRFGNSSYAYNQQSTLSLNIKL